VVRYQIVAAHFPRPDHPTLVIAPRKAAQVQQDHRRDPGVVSATESGQAHWIDELVEVVCGDRRPPASDQAFKTITALRHSIAIVSLRLWWRPDAQALDVRNAATHDRVLLIPVILAVILVSCTRCYVGTRAADLLARPFSAAGRDRLGIGPPARLRVPGLGQQRPIARLPVSGRPRLDLPIFLVTARSEEPRGAARATALSARCRHGG